MNCHTGSLKLIFFCTNVVPACWYSTLSWEQWMGKQSGKNDDSWPRHSATWLPEMLAKILVSTLIIRLDMVERCKKIYSKLACWGQTSNPRRFWKASDDSCLSRSDHMIWPLAKRSSRCKQHVSAAPHPSQTSFPSWYGWLRILRMLPVRWDGDKCAGSGFVRFLPCSNRPSAGSSWCNASCTSTTWDMLRRYLWLKGMRGYEGPMSAE